MKRTPRSSSPGLALKAAAIVASVSLTAACFGGASAGSGKGGTGAAAEDAGPPQSGGTLVQSTTADARSLDPHKEASYAVHGAIGAVYSRLVAYKTGPDVPYGTSEVEGDLAEKWSSSEDGLTWTFNLRKGVRFQNIPPVNGRELTSADVMCTIDRINTLPGHQRGLLALVEDVKAPDDHTVEFSLSSPFAAFDETLANPFLVILPCEGTEGKFDLTTTAIGTGPFILKKWLRDQERQYVKNPDYYVEGKPYLDGYTTTIMPDAQAQIAALRSGKLDMMTGLSTEKRQVQALVKQMPDLQLREEAGTTQTRIYMNAERKPFDDVRVRRAVAMAIDRKGMLSGIRAGGQVTGPITPTFFGALPNEEVEKLTPFDPAQSKKLLAEAGYPSGFEVTMIVTTGYGETIVREAQWVLEDLAKVGIKATLEVQDYAKYVGDTWPSSKYDIMYGLQTPMLSADQYLTSEWASDGGRNWSKVNDPELDRMIEEQRIMADPAKREKALQEIDRYIIEKVSTPLPLYVYTGQTLMSGKVHGYHPHPDYSAREYENIWLDQGK